MCLQQKEGFGSNFYLSLSTPTTILQIFWSFFWLYTTDNFQSIVLVSYSNCLQNSADLMKNTIFWRCNLYCSRNMEFNKAVLKTTLMCSNFLSAENIRTDRYISINPDILPACSYGVKSHYFVTTLMKIR